MFHFFHFIMLVNSYCSANVPVEMGADNQHRELSAAVTHVLSTQITKHLNEPFSSWATIISRPTALSLSLSGHYISILEHLRRLFFGQRDALGFFSAFSSFCCGTIRRYVPPLALAAVSKANRKGSYVSFREKSLDVFFFLSDGQKVFLFLISFYPSGFQHNEPGWNKWITQNPFKRSHA